MIPLAAAAGLAALLVLAAPATALAAPTVTLVNRVLTVTGEAANEQFTIDQVSDRVQVKGPSGMNDPDGGGDICATAPLGSIVSCADEDIAGVLVDGAGGNDTLQDNRAVTPDGDVLVGGAGDDVLTAPVGAGGGAMLVGGVGADRLTRNSAAGSLALLLGGPGNDVIDAGAGSLGPSDEGNEGDDTFNGASQVAEFFVAGPGADTYNGGTRTPAPGEVVGDPASYQLRNAPDTVVYSGVDSLVVSLDGQANDGAAGERDNVMPDVERVDGGSGDDQLIAGAYPVNLRGEAGDDRLVGSDGDDNLYGDGGSDTLTARGGDDNLDDGDQTPQVQTPTLPPAGHDRLDGGPGDDSLHSDRGADELIGGVGHDRTFFARVIPRAPGAPPPSLPASFEISLDDSANDGQRGAAEGDNIHGDIEEIYSGDGDDVITGSPGPDAIRSQGGDDRIDPAGGADHVQAGQGDDGISAVDQTTDRLECDMGDDSVHADLPGEQPERADVTVGCETITGVPFGPRAFADTTPPTITNLRASRRRFAAGRRSTPRAAAAVKRGTTFRFTLSEDARVTITIARRLAGRRRGGRCVVRARSGKRCARLVKAATLVRANSPAGRKRIAYSGRVGGRALRPGSYRATVRAVDSAGNRAIPRSLALTVVKPRG